MLDGMDFGGIHDWFVVGAGHTDVKCSDHRAVRVIFSGHIDARKKTDVVHGKACDFFHNIEFLSGAGVIRRCFSVIVRYYSRLHGKRQGSILGIKRRKGDTGG